MDDNGRTKTVDWTADKPRPQCNLCGWSFPYVWMLEQHDCANPSEINLTMRNPSGRSIVYRTAEMNAIWNKRLDLAYEREEEMASPKPSDFNMIMREPGADAVRYLSGDELDQLRKGPDVMMELHDFTNTPETKKRWWQRKDKDMAKNEQAQEQIDDLEQRNSNLKTTVAKRDATNAALHRRLDEHQEAEHDRMVKARVDALIVRWEEQRKRIAATIGKDQDPEGVAPGVYVFAEGSEGARYVKTFVHAYWCSTQVANSGATTIIIHGVDARASDDQNDVTLVYPASVGPIAVYLLKERPRV